MSGAFSTTKSTFSASSAPKMRKNIPISRLFVLRTLEPQKGPPPKSLLLLLAMKFSRLLNLVLALGFIWLHVDRVNIWHKTSFQLNFKFSRLILRLLVAETFFSIKRSCFSMSSLLSVAISRIHTLICICSQRNSIRKLALL